MYTSINYFYSFVKLLLLYLYKNVLNYKKPSFWVVLVSVIALITVAIGLMFNPINNEESNKYLEDNNLKGISLLERGYDEPDKVIHLTN